VKNVAIIIRFLIALAAMYPLLDHSAHAQSMADNASGTGAVMAAALR
jgi:hypothetical protein